MDCITLYTGSIVQNQNPKIKARTLRREATLLEMLYVFHDLLQNLAKNSTTFLVYVHDFPARFQVYLYIFVYKLYNKINQLMTFIYGNAGL